MPQKKNRYPTWEISLCLERWKKTDINSQRYLQALKISLEPYIAFGYGGGGGGRKIREGGQKLQFLQKILHEEHAFRLALGE